MLEWQRLCSRRTLCGKYYYVETRTLPGHVIDRQRHPFEIKDDESTELQLVSDRLHNAHVRIRLQFHKQMEEPQYSELGDALANVRFGIFAVSDICFSDGSIGIPAGQLISVSGVDAQGMLEDCPDLPQGDYVLRSWRQMAISAVETEYPFTVSFGQEDVSMITIAGRCGQRAQTREHRADQGRCRGWQLAGRRALCALCGCGIAGSGHGGRERYGWTDRV
ncbi:MAG: hypothetical protein ACLVJ6_17350 [Merdibacter sp.]